MPGLGSSGGGGKCNYYNRTGNTTDPFSIRANYGGIPEALVLNLLGWLALLVLFLVIRKNVFNVLSRGLQRNLGRITEVLFSPDLSRESLSDSESSESAGRPGDPETGEDTWGLTPRSHSPNTDLEEEKDEALEQHLLELEEDRDSDSE